MRALQIWLVLACAGAVSCSSSGSNHEPKSQKKTTELVGIDPLGYKCEDLVAVADVAAALDGEVTLVETAFEPPPGTAKPCGYLRTHEGSQQPWSFDMDCRDSALKDAHKLFTQYQTTAGDAGVTAVEVGDRGIDHRGQAILFIDTDTPCYVRIHGPTAEGRLSLAKLIAEKLTPKTAPMRPRPAE